MGHTKKSFYFISYLFIGILTQGFLSSCSNKNIFSAPNSQTNSVTSLQELQRLGKCDQLPVRDEIHKHCCKGHIGCHKNKSAMMATVSNSTTINKDSDSNDSDSNSNDRENDCSKWKPKDLAQVCKDGDDNDKIDTDKNGKPDQVECQPSPSPSPDPTTLPPLPN